MLSALSDLRHSFLGCYQWWVFFALVTSSSSTGHCPFCTAQTIPREITSPLEGKLHREGGDESLDEPRVLLKGKGQWDDDRVRSWQERANEDCKQVILPVID